MARRISFMRVAASALAILMISSYLWIAVLFMDTKGLTLPFYRNNKNSSITIPAGDSVLTLEEDGNVTVAYRRELEPAAYRQQDMVNFHPMSDFTSMPLQYRSVKMVADVLTPWECQVLINHIETKGLLHRSMVSVCEPGKTNEHFGGIKCFRVVSPYRRSFTAELESPGQGEEVDNIIKKVQERGMSVSGIRDPERLRVLEVHRYLPGEYGTGHEDGSSVAFGIFLTDDFEGGQTNFPFLGLKFQPAMGQGLLYFNVHESGRRLPWMRHEARNVTGPGAKYIVLQFIR